MKAARAAIVALTLAALMAPLVGGVTFIGAINFVATGGGIVQFSQTFQASSLTYARGLNHFTDLVWAGTNLDSIGLDAATCNITVNAMTPTSLTYTVAGVGVGMQYVYYRGLTEPMTVTGGTATYAGGVTTVTTLGSPVVTITWSTLPTTPRDIIGSVPGYFPLLAVALTVFAGFAVLLAYRGEMELNTAVTFIIFSGGIIITAIVIYSLIAAVT